MHPVRRGVVASMGSNALAAHQKTSEHHSRPIFHVVDGESMQNRRSQTLYCSRGRCCNLTADTASSRTCKLGIGISYVCPSAFVSKKSVNSPCSPDDLVRRHNIVRLYDATRDYRNSKVIICDVHSEAMCSVWSETFPHDQSH